MLDRTNTPSTLTDGYGPINDFKIIYELRCKFEIGRSLANLISWRRRGPQNRRVVVRWYAVSVHLIVNLEIILEHKMTFRASGALNIFICSDFHFKIPSVFSLLSDSEMFCGQILRSKSRKRGKRMWWNNRCIILFQNIFDVQGLWFEGTEVENTGVQGFKNR